MKGVEGGSGGNSQCIMFSPAHDFVDKDSQPDLFFLYLFVLFSMSYNCLYHLLCEVRKKLIK